MMRTSRAYRGTVIGLIAAVALSATPAPVAACTRALYVAKDGTVIVGRSMDWGEDTRSR
jgi:penicillin V acylase-like amidase (Ntn superfamily)